MRIAINVAYAHIAMGSDRKQLDADLYAPVDGWDQADARLWEALDAKAQRDTEDEAA